MQVHISSVVFICLESRRVQNNAITQCNNCTAPQPAPHPDLTRVNIRSFLEIENLINCYYYYLLFYDYLLGKLLFLGQQPHTHKQPLRIFFISFPDPLSILYNSFVTIDIAVCILLHCFLSLHSRLPLIPNRWALQVHWYALAICLYSYFLHF